MSPGEKTRAPWLAPVVLVVCVAARIIAGTALPGAVWLPEVNAAALGFLLAALCTVLAICARALIVPKMRDVPRGAQGYLETLAVFISALARLCSRVRGAMAKAGAKMKRIAAKKITARILAAAALCAAIGVLLGRLFPHSGGHELSVSMGSPEVRFLGLNVPSSIVFTWCIMAVLFALALVLRLALVPRLRDRPRGMQNTLETIIEACESFTKSHVHGVSRALSPYVFAVGCYLVAGASIELIGLRPPTSDVTVTFALSAITFLLINYYGLKANGVRGRAKQYVRPRAFMAPFKLLSDVSIPISLACRLFGNMLGGMIVMNLLYMALGNFAVGIPAVLGLYFNLFHPLIQTFIFIKLSLSFIEEAID